MNNPEIRRMDEVNAESLMFFSANGPNVAAPIPKKKMFKQNVNATCVVVQPSKDARWGANRLKE
jgi:hypothetical protein